jgi:hypothetical protein
MAHQFPDLNDITADDLPGLTADTQHCARRAEWSLASAAAKAASLANAGGGLVVVEATDGLDEATLLSVGAALQPDGERLVEARMLATPEGTVGLLAVRECADPPVLAGDDGTGYRRGVDGAEAVRSRAGLDELYGKRQRLRERAEHVIDAQVERTALDHSSYYTIALITAPLLAGSRSRAWALENTQSLLSSAMASRWGLEATNVADEGAVTEIRRPVNESGFIVTVGNGATVVGVRDRRPTLDRFFTPSELAAQLGEFAEVTRMLAAGGDAGPVLPALYLEFCHDLRLEAADGYGAPCSVSTQCSVLSPRYLETDADRDVLVAEMAETLGPLFGADLVAGTVPAYEGAAAPEPTPKGWHGNTRRTERRVAGERGFGSGP